MLLEAGANVNQRDDAGMTAADWVTCNGKGAVAKITMQILLEWAADIDGARRATFSGVR